MEAMAIAEGFLISEEMHGVRYSKFIADGDSSVYTTILEYRPYDTLTVEKIECRNHLLRNFNNKLKEISTSSYNGDDTNKELYLKMRRALGNRLLRCRVGVKKAIEQRKNEEGSLKTKADKLREDIINSPSHVFGEHKKCEEIGYFCNGVPKEGEINLVEDMKSCGMYQKIMIAVNSLADYSYHLIQDVDSNSVEQYNSVIAMYTGGKRTNQIQRNGYQTRCAAAVVKYNSRQPFYKLHKSITKSSPGSYAKLYEARAKRKAERDLERSRKNPKSRRSLVMTAAGPDKYYGPHAQKPDIEDALYETKVNEHLEKLRKTDNEIAELERLTVNQKDNTLWLEQRRLRLTASSFGLVCNRREDSSCGPVVKKLLYSKVDCPATRYGQAHEADAVSSFETLTGCVVSKCGLFIDRQRPWLAASPDGLVGEDALIEVKCPLTGKNMTPDEVVEKKKGVVGSFWQYDKTNDLYSVNKRHPYHYQIQGQLQITQRQFGFLVLWTPLGVRFEKVVRDDCFWETNMVSKLERFYFSCLLPEIIDPRRRRNMTIREPLYILEAKREKMSKKEKKLKMCQRKNQ